MTNESVTPRHPPEVGHLAVGFAVFLVALLMQHGGAITELAASATRNLITAKAIAAGEGYRLLHLPGAPAPPAGGPLYPFVLAAVWKIWPLFPANIVLMEILDAVLVGIGAGLVAKYSRRLQIPWWAGYAGAFVGCLSAATLSASVTRTGAPLLLVLFGATLVAAERARTRPGAVLAGVLAAACGLVDPRAFAVPLVVVGLFVLRRRYPAAGVTAVPGLVALAAWLLWFRSAEPVAGAPEWLVRVPSFMGVSGLGGLTDVATSLLPAWLGVVVGSAVALTAAWGLIDAGTSRAFGAAVAGTMAALSFGGGESAAAMVPWLAVAFVVGCVRMWGRLRAVRLPVAAFAVGVGVLAIPPMVGRVLGGVASGADRERAAAIAPIARSVARELPADAVVASVAADILYLYAATEVARLGVPGADESGDALCGRGVSYVAALRVPTVDEAAVDALRANGRLVPLFELTDGPALYRLTCG